MLGLSGFVFIVLFWPGIASAATTPRWAFLAIVCPATLLFMRSFKITTPHILLLIYLAWATIGLAWSPILEEAGAEWSRLVIFVCLFWIGAELKSLREILIGAALSLVINSAITIAQVYGWQEIPQLGPPGGLFMNKNMGAEITALVLIGVVAHRIWWLIPGLLPSIYYPHSRAAELALVVVAIIWLAQKAPRIALILFAIGLAAFAVDLLISGDSSVVERTNIWLDTISALNWRGHGIGSFYIDYPIIGHRIDVVVARPEHAHNDILEIAFEFGIVGILIATAFIALISRKGALVEKSILIGFAVESFFSFSLHMPATSALFALVAGRLAVARPSIRDDIVACRSAIHAWLERRPGKFSGRLAPSHDGKTAISA